MYLPDMRLCQPHQFLCPSRTLQRLAGNPTEHRRDVPRCPTRPPTTTTNLIPYRDIMLQQSLSPRVMKIAALQTCSSTYYVQTRSSSPPSPMLKPSFQDTKGQSPPNSRPFSRRATGEKKPTTSWPAFRCSYSVNQSELAPCPCCQAEPLSAGDGP